VTSCPTAPGGVGASHGGKRDEGSLEGSLEERQADGLAGLGAGQITAGCKCLSLAPRTVTSTSTPTTVSLLSDCNYYKLRAEN
jgi:hypothetical protein